MRKRRKMPYCKRLEESSLQEEFSQAVYFDLLEDEDE